MMSRFLSTLSFGAIGLASISAGGAPADAPEPPTATVPRAPARAAHEIVQMIGEALSEVSLRPDQEAIVETLGNVVEPLQTRVGEAEDAVLSALAQQVRNGSIDRSALAPSIRAFVSARVGLAGTLRSAIERLHEILDPDQRADFADALACRVHEAIRVARSDEIVDAFADQIGANPTQRAAIRDAIEELRPMMKAERRDVHAAIEAFRGDVFAVEPYMPISAVPAQASARAERIVDVTERIMAVLDPTQRRTLAARIESAAMTSEAAPEQPAEAAQGALRAPGEDPGAEEDLDDVSEARWVGVRGPRGGVVVAGSRNYTWGRAYRYPVAWGWGVGW